ncbi:hypothetical protein Syun_008091 [Stephania yunnanensis]|uniref:Smr domain-containing protein n=1 Tax=Stephania yunnanensis TaxID=152371 RepID=A0AAP0L0R1_9MAGN
MRQPNRAQTQSPKTLARSPPSPHQDPSFPAISAAAAPPASSPRCTSAAPSPPSPPATPPPRRRPWSRPWTWRPRRQRRPHLRLAQLPGQALRLRRLQLLAQRVREPRRLLQSRVLLRVRDREGAQAQRAGEVGQCHDKRVGEIGESRLGQECVRGGQCRWLWEHCVRVFGPDQRLRPRRVLGEGAGVFDSMKELGLRPNLVTYNAVIDACAKGGAEFSRALEFLDEMVKNGVQPDRITFNSLLAVCGRSGLWEDAKNLFHEMVYRGIHQDIFTYNTLLDAVCKGGQMELAFEIMSDMPSKGVWPNVVTYSTVIDGCAKAGKLEEALNLFEEMKLLGIRLDRISYNTLLAVYASLGRFEEALDVCKEMEASGIRKDVVTYNALMGGYGKQGNYYQVQKLFREMKAQNLSPNILTYSTLIDVYSKGGMHLEAMETFKELKQAGLEIDVVLYSSLIDALCKNGLVESAVSLLDEMTKKGIRPNVVTYNSIIDAFGRSAVVPSQEGSINGANGTSDELLTSIVPRGTSGSKEGDEEDDNKVMKLFEQLAAEKACPSREDTSGKSKEILCILELFKKMHELKIKPNVVTFSAILNACSRCNSFEDASMLLEELRLFDNQVYGVAHGLLKGGRENVWVQAQCLFDEVKRMDSSTASAFYNALTDMLWHFGQKRGAQLVVLEGKRRQVWENVWSDSCLDLHLMSSGAAQAMVHAWLLNIRAIVYEGHELPKLLSILTGWGKHSKVAGDGTLRRVVEALLIRMGAPFHVAKCNIGRFISTGAVVTAWLRESGTLNVLILHDDRMHSEPAGLEQQERNMHVLSL